MAKIYGTPIMAGGAGGANKDLPPLLDNFKASKAEGATTPIKETASGTKVYFGTLNGQRLIWRVSRYSKDNKIYFISDDILPEDMEYDAIEPSNPNGTTATYGNSNLLLSNIYQWLNSDKGANEWYTATHEYDAPPNYQNKAGFLNEWSDMEKSLIQEHERQTLEEITKVPGEPGELPQDQYTFTNHTHKVSLLDYTESAPKGSISGAEHFDVFTDDDSRKQSRISFSNGPIDIQNGSWVPMVLTDGTRKGGLSAGDSSHSGNGVRPIVPINENLTYISKEPDESGIYEVVDPNSFVTIQADKMLESRANELAGAVWVYGDHEPTSVNDGTKIQLAREEVVTSDGGEAQTVTKTVEWNNEADFFARQFTYNSKKQYQTMLEGAIATLVLTGVPDPVTELAEQHSGSSITLTWKNPTSDELYDHTVVVYKTDAFPTAIDDGTQGYSGTDETATLSGLELGSTYYIAVFTVSAYGLYGEPQTVQVEIPAGKLLSSLASGTKVKLGKWNNTDLQWKVARDTSDQKIRLVLEPTSASLLGNKMYDNKEPSNSDTNRRNYGNNRYIYSNIHQWLNATEATSWYTAQHSADAAPDYSSQAGFLSGWSENHIAALDRATLTVSRSSTDGGGTETFVARVALISTAELGLQSGTGGGRLDIFNSDGDRSTGAYYWTRTPYPSNSYNAYPVTSAGALYDYGNFGYIANGVRPLCIPVSTALVSLEMDDDRCYVVQ